MTNVVTDWNRLPFRCNIRGKLTTIFLDFEFLDASTKILGTVNGAIRFQYSKLKQRTWKQERKQEKNYKMWNPPHSFHQTLVLFIGILYIWYYYLLTESGVFTGKSQTEPLPYWAGMIARLIRQGRGLRISPKDLTFDVNKFFCYMVLPWFCEPVIGSWALQESNANHRGRNIGYKHKPYNNCC